MDLKLYINEVEFNFTDRYTIREQVGQPSTSAIEIKLDGKDLPVSHTKIVLKDDGVAFYAGYINKVDTPTYSSTFETDIVPIEIISLETIFTRRIVSEAYVSKFTHEIIEDLYDNYLDEENITLGTIEEFERTYSEYVIPNLRLSDVLQELGDEVGAVAKIDENNVFSFTTKASFPDVAPPTHITKLKLTENGQDLKTVQKISGAKSETSFQTVLVTWISAQTAVLLGYQVSEEPTITINGTPVGVGVVGLGETDISKTFLWAYANNSIVLNNTATVQPAAGDTISVIFKGFFDVEIISENEDLKNEIALISGTSGKIESIVIDTSITDPQDGETTAINLLQEKSVRSQTVTLQCQDITKSALLNQWYLDYPDLNIQGSYVIVERSISDFYDKYKITVKLKNRGFYSRYGTVYNKNNKEINNLSIRTDTAVLKQSSVFESVMWEDDWEAAQDFMELTPGTFDTMSPGWFLGSTVARG